MARTLLILSAEPAPEMPLKPLFLRDIRVVTVAWTRYKAYIITSYGQRPHRNNNNNLIYCNTPKTAGSLNSYLGEPLEIQMERVLLPKNPIAINWIRLTLGP